MKRSPAVHPALQRNSLARLVTGGSAFVVRKGPEHCGTGRRVEAVLATCRSAVQTDPWEAEVPKKAECYMLGTPGVRVKLRLIRAWDVASESFFCLYAAVESGLTYCELVERMETCKPGDSLVMLGFSDYHSGSYSYPCDEFPAGFRRFSPICGWTQSTGNCVSALGSVCAGTYDSAQSHAGGPVFLQSHSEDVPPFWTDFALCGVSLPRQTAPGLREVYELAANSSYCTEFAQARIDLLDSLFAERCTLAQQWNNAKVAMESREGRIAQASLYALADEMRAAVGEDSGYSQFLPVASAAFQRGLAVATALVTESRSFTSWKDLRNWAVRF